MFDAAPLSKRPSWYAATTVDPHEKLSGSTAVSCWLAGFVDASTESRRETTSQFAATRSARVGADDVAAGAAVDAVDAAERGLDRVVSGAGDDRVGLRRADDQLAERRPANRRRRCGSRKRERREDGNEPPHRL